MISQWNDRSLGRSPEKKTAFLLDFVKITSPLFGQLVQLFSDVKIQDLKDILGLKILIVLYIILYIYNLKRQFKVHIIGILEEIDSFIDQKCTYWKCAKKFGKNPKESIFSQENVPIRSIFFIREDPLY